jgi:hypothetical protein
LFSQLAIVAHLAVEGVAQSVTKELDTVPVRQQQKANTAMNVNLVTMDFLRGLLMRATSVNVIWVGLLPAVVNNQVNNELLYAIRPCVIMVFSPLITETNVSVYLETVDSCFGLLSQFHMAFNVSSFFS